MLIRFLACFAAAVALVHGPALGQSTDHLKVVEQAWKEAMAASTAGPADIALGSQAKLHLGRDYSFVPKAETGRLMRVFGNGVGEGLYGMVVPKADDQSWIITINHTAEGYVKDDDARNWDAEALLQNLKDGTEAQNQTRIEQGVPALDITGWIEKPGYDAERHRLIWSLRAEERGAAAGAAATVNYNTYALGRDGYFELNLLTSDDVIDGEKRHAKAALAALEYLPGKGYGDFNSETDLIAEYGLAALIGGVAAKKLGLLALIGVFVLKFAKLIAVGVAIAGGVLFKLFRRNRSES